MPSRADLTLLQGKSGEQPAIELQLPATPFAYRGHDLRRGVVLHVYGANGSVLEGRLGSLSLPDNRLTLSTPDGHLRQVDLRDAEYLRFGESLQPDGGQADLERAVPFLIRFVSGREHRGMTLGALRSTYGLTLFEKVENRLHRLFVPAAAILQDRVGQQRVDEADAASPNALPTTGGHRHSPAPAGHDNSEARARALAQKLGLVYLAPADIAPDPDAVKCVPASIAREYAALPLSRDEHRLRLVTSNPGNPQMINVIQFMAGRPVEIAVAAEPVILERIDEYYGGVFEELAVRDLEASGEPPPEGDSPEELEKLSNEKPIVRFVSGMLNDAIRKRASDIHIRPTEDSVDILYRIDGMLLPSHHADKRLHRAIVSRIKILGHMDISERRIPQDGRLEVHQNGRKVDLRISIMPTVDGESVVIRLLDTSASIKSIDQLGLNARDTDRFQDLISRSQGMFLVTGPTGSGKSTTLYAAIGAVREKPVNIMTVEDPVEYHMAGVEQIQVNRAVDLTFPRALRNILRHDPDVIMIGEIRDEETARIAMKSALTGHLVLSTLHTNSAVKTIARLLDMGTERFLLQSTVIGILAQRLVRKNCPHCREPVRADIRELTLLGLEADSAPTFYRGAGCEACHDTGYKGRCVTYELLYVSDDIRQAIAQGADEASLTRLATAGGMIPLTDHVLSLARDGETSLEEVLRVRLD